MTRLPIQTIGGHASESDTFAQLIEHLRLAEEAAAIIGHLRKANDDSLTGQGWLAVSEMLHMTVINVTNFATKAMRTSVGYR